MAAVVPLKVASGVIQQFAAGDTIAAAYLSGVAPLTGATFTGNVIIDCDNAAIVIDASTGTISGAQFHEAGVLKAQLAQDYSGAIVGQDNAFFFQNVALGAPILFLGKAAGGGDRFLAQYTPTWQAFYYDNTATLMTASGGANIGDGANWLSISKSGTTAVIQNNDDGIINIRGAANICVSANPAGSTSLYNTGVERFRAGTLGVTCYGTNHSVINSTTDAQTAFVVEKSENTTGRPVYIVVKGGHYQDTPTLYFNRPHSSGGSSVTAGQIWVAPDNGLKILNAIDSGVIYLMADDSGGSTKICAQFSALDQYFYYNQSGRLRTASGGPESSVDGTNWFPLMQVSGGRRITVGTSTPASPSVGDLWVDTN